ncbi:MAG: hypothetical protein ACRD3E_05215 [Terriglobales bacterium]
MLGTRLVNLIEHKSDELSKGMAEKLRSSSRTEGYRNLSQSELAKAAREVFSNLSEWLMTKTESDIELRYTGLGSQRAKQHIPLPQLVWAILMTKEHLLAFLRREGMVESPLQVYGELELLQLLDLFFDRAVYYAVCGYSDTAELKAA